MRMAFPRCGFACEQSNCAFWQRNMGSNYTCAFCWWWGSYEALTSSCPEAAAHAVGDKQCLIRVGRATTMMYEHWTPNMHTCNSNTADNSPQSLSCASASSEPEWRLMLVAHGSSDHTFETSCYHIYTKPKVKIITALDTCDKPYVIYLCLLNYTQRKLPQGSSKLG